MPVSLLKSISVSALDGFCRHNNNRHQILAGVQPQVIHSQSPKQATFSFRHQKIPLITWLPLLQLSCPPPTSATHSHGHTSTLSLSTNVILPPYCSQTGLPASPLLLQSILSAAARAIKQSQIMSLLLKSFHLTENTRQSPYNNMQSLTRSRHLLFLQSHLLLLPITYSDPTPLTLVFPQDAQPQGLCNCCSLCLKCSSPK